MTLAIDIGSNTAKCLLGEKRGGGVEKICESSMNNRISTGDGKLVPDAARKISYCVKSFVDLAAGSYSGDFAVKIVATSALRESAESGSVIEEVKKETGFDIKILSGDDEAGLSYLGAMSDPALASLNETAFFDLGGGSLELVFGKGKTAKQAFSFELGAVRMSKKFDSFGAVAPETLAKISEYADGQLKKSLREIPPFKTLAGAGGAVVAARFMKSELGLSGAENVITLSDMQIMLDALAPLSPEERVRQYAISEGRADIMPAAFAVIIALMKFLKIGRLTHTFHNIRYGLVLEG